MSEVNVEVRPVRPRYEKIIVTLSEDEARTLKAVYGTISGSRCSSRRAYTEDLYYKLRSLDLGDIPLRELEGELHFNDRRD